MFAVFVSLWAALFYPDDEDDDVSLTVNALSSHEPLSSHHHLLLRESGHGGSRSIFCPPGGFPVQTGHLIPPVRPGSTPEPPQVSGHPDPMSRTTVQGLILSLAEDEGWTVDDLVDRSVDPFSRHS